MRRRQQTCVTTTPTVQTPSAVIHVPVRRISNSRPMTSHVNVSLKNTVLCINLKQMKQNDDGDDDDDHEDDDEQKTSFGLFLRLF